MSVHDTPSGWAYSSLGLVCSKLTDGSHTPPKGTEAGQPMLSAKNIQNGKIDFLQGHRLIPTDLFEVEDRRTRVSAQDVLLTIVGALGRTAIVPENCNKFTLQRSVAVLTASHLNARAFRYSLENHEFQKQILDNAKGTAQKGIYLRKLKELIVPVPPLAEQKVIADKLDALLAQVESTKARLDRIPQILKRFRQSVLAAAVSGRLTEEGRGSNNFSHIKSTLGECVAIDIGHAFKSKDFTPEGIPLLRGQNIEPGALRWSETKFFPEEKLRDHSHLFIREGDILLAMDRPIISSGLKLARAKSKDLPCVLVQRVTRFKEFKGLLPNYLYILLQDISFINYIQPNQTGSDIPHISGKQILAYPIQLPTVAEQTEIVRRVDQLFAYADRIEQQVNNAQERVNNLTQSILAKAFRGELTEQWRKDNPELISGDNSAEALLERIKTERAAIKPAKRSRKKASA